MLLYLRYQVY